MQDASSERSTLLAQTSRPLREEERDEIEEEGRERYPSAKDLGSARSLFRSSKLYLRTALTNHFNTAPRRLPAENYDCFQMKRLWKHVHEMQFFDLVAGLNERSQVPGQSDGIAGDIDDLRCGDSR